MNVEEEAFDILTPGQENTPEGHLIPKESLSLRQRFVVFFAQSSTELFACQE